MPEWCWSQNKKMCITRWSRLVAKTRVSAHVLLNRRYTESPAIQASQDEIVLGDIKSGRTVHVVVPYSGSAAAESSRVSHCDISFTQSC